MTDGATAILRLQGVAKSYGATRVLHPIDLEVMDGEFLTILGPSGSGKTTILRLIGGFTRPDEGRILLDGADIAGTPPFARPFNTVFQDYALFPHMTVRKNVGYGLRTRGVPRDETEKRVDQVLEIVGLAPLSGRYPAEMSGGQRQRAALARAIVCEPRIVLLDEPLAALDAELRRSMRGFLKDLQRRIGTSFVFITHDQEEAIAVSDRIVVTSEGRIEQIGSPEDIYYRPASRFVAGFFGENNILPLRGSGWGLFEADLGTAVAGDADAIAIRPESIRIVAGDRARVAGTVEAVEFLGAVSEATVCVDGHRVRVRMPTDANDRPAVPGASVGLWWSDDAINLLYR
jgi:spermidine/putrescine transport system ATP-binding protein